MPKKPKEKAFDALRNMNLEPNGNDLKKEPYKRDREIADQVGANPAAVNYVRRGLFFAEECGIDIDKSIVYAWRWSGDNKYAKIGRSKSGYHLRETIKARSVTFHPTDEIHLIGIKYSETPSREEKRILDTLDRTHPKREWVCINENFNELINNEFIKIERIVE